MLRVGTIGFGGGAVLIPVVEDEVVRRRGLVTPQQFRDHTLIANLTPGALPVKLAALAGAELGHPMLALAAACAVALPGALAAVTLLAGFRAFGPAGIRLVESAAVGISAFIIVLLGHFVLKVIRQAGHRRPQVVAIIAASFLATGTPVVVSTVGLLFGQDWHIPPLRLTALHAIVLAIGLIAIGHWLCPGPRPEGDGSASRVAWLSATGFAVVLAGVLTVSALWPDGRRFLGLVGLSTITSFGGGEAYVAVADGSFVSSGLVASTLFYGHIVPIANALPGPILIKIASSLGFSFGLSVGGWPLAVAFALGAFLVAVSASCAPATALLAGHAKVARSPFVNRLTYIMPVICGLLITTSFSMLQANLEVAVRANVPMPAVGWATVLGVVALSWLRARFRLRDLTLLALGGACSTVALLVASG